MKSLIYLLLLAGISISFFNSCTDEPEIKEISGKVTNYSDCKSFDELYRSPLTPDTLSCIEYTFDANTNILSLKHINSGFNCCPGKLTCSVSVQNDTITIKESEESALCDCSCLFDLNIEIEGVEDKLYYLKVIEPYCGNQEKLYFDLDLNNTKESTYCVRRKNYPWAIH